MRPAASRNDCSVAEIPVLFGGDRLHLCRKLRRRRHDLVDVLERSRLHDLDLERLRQHRHAASDRVDAVHDLIDVGAGWARRNRVVRRVRSRRHRNWRRERDRDVAEDSDRFDGRHRSLRDLILVEDADQDLEISVAAQRYVADVSDAHAGQQHRLSLLEILSPREPRVQRIAVLQPAANEPQRSEQKDDDSHCDDNADRDFVATFHVCRSGCRRNAVSASRTRIVTEAITTARAVDRPTPSAPASVM